MRPIPAALTRTYLTDNVRGLEDQSQPVAATYLGHGIQCQLQEKEESRAESYESITSF